MLAMLPSGLKTYTTITDQRMPNLKKIPNFVIISKDVSNSGIRPLDVETVFKSYLYTPK